MSGATPNPIRFSTALLVLVRTENILDDLNSFNVQVFNPPVAGEGAKALRLNADAVRNLLRSAADNYPDDPVKP